MNISSAFVAGATGFTGREVVSQLVPRGIRTIAHVRPDSSRLDGWRERFEGLGASTDTTPWDTVALAATLASLKPSIIFALIGTTRRRMAETSKEAASYEAVDYGLTKMLLDAAVRSGASPRFIYLSASGVSERNPTAYMKARWKAEKAIRESGLPYIIARPAFITGQGRDDSRPLEKAGSALFDTVLSAAALVGAGKLRDRYRSITNVELAGALIKLALNPENANRIIEREGLTP